MNDSSMKFGHLKVGDKVVRVMGGTVRMNMVVREVGELLLTCDAIDRDTGKIIKGGWTFDRMTGIEEDADLQWGIKYGRTGSVLLAE